MRVVNSLADAQLHTESVITIGAFDGIHRGHRAVIDRVRRAAVEQQRASVVVTFFPHPGVVLGRLAPFYLTSTEEKVAVLNTVGIDLLVVMPFTIETSHTRAAEYVSWLVTNLRMHEVHVGYDFAFGYKREGNVAFLRQAGVERGFRVCEVEALTNGVEAISSTGIRQALRQGDVATAAHWLGRPFRLSGTVDQYQRLNATPNASQVQLDVWQEHAIPADGDYTGWAWVGNLKFEATISTGTQTGADGKQVRSVAAHLPGVAYDITGMNLALDFVTCLRTGDQS